MNLQIERLIVWSKTAGKRNEVKFALNQVNVLSGESRTGKSAVSSIIDYCLGSSECTIPIGRVRENVSWYGIIVVTDAGRCLFARRNPVDEACTSECIIREINSDADIPDSIPAGTEDVSEIKTMLEQLSGVPDIQRSEYGFTGRKLGFRDTTHLLFQVQDVVANRYILFYKMQKYEILEHFAAWFNFIIGAETLNDVMHRQEIVELNRELKQIEAENDKLQRKALSWSNKLRAKMVEAKSYGFCYPDTDVPEDDKKLLAEATRIIKNEKQLLNSVRQDNTVGDEITRLREECRVWAERIDGLAHEVSELQDLKDTILRQGSSTRRLKDRLSIALWLKKNARPVESVCPVCGGHTHEEAAHELEKIIKVVDDCERALQNTEKFPAATLTEILGKEKRLAEWRGQQRDRDDQLKELAEANARISNDWLERTNAASALIGTLKCIVELNEQIKLNVDDTRLKEIKKRLKELKEVFDEKVIAQREEERLSKIGDLALVRLKTLDSEEQYRLHPPVFNKRDMNIRIKDEKGHEHTLGEVGSASNWVAFHIAVTCAFQEFFAAMADPSSVVPNFMIYDQPSQVYFPSAKKVQKDPHAEGEPVPEDEPSETDKKAVRMIFETIAASIAETQESCGRTWQAIVLEHAGSEIYGDIPGVNVIDPPWRQGKALVPHDWYDGGDDAAGA